MVGSTTFESEFKFVRPLISVNGVKAGEAHSSAAVLIMIQGEPSRMIGNAMVTPPACYLVAAAATTAGGSPSAHSRQSGTVQFEGQLPPSAMNKAAVSEMRLASVCTRTTAAVR